MDQSGRPLAQALLSNGPAADRALQMQAYGWLVGSWDLDVLIGQQDGGTRTLRGFVSADWVLEGRAIQDVFAVPELFYGTTLRVYDPNDDVWRVTWADPKNQVFLNLVGRLVGGEIVNEGDESPSLARLYGQDQEEKAVIRWIFSDIGKDAFRWRSERSTDRQHWLLQRSYIGRRVAA